MSNDVEFKIQLTPAELAVGDHALRMRIKELCKPMSKVVTFGNRVAVDPDERPRTYRVFIPENIVGAHKRAFFDAVVELFMKAVAEDADQYLVPRR